jgi:hypothetical protein
MNGAFSSDAKGSLAGPEVHYGHSFYNFSVFIEEDVVAL